MMPLSKAAGAIKKMNEDGQRELLAQKIPAGQLSGQIVPQNLGPRGNTGTGYTPGDASVTTAKLADGAVTTGKVDDGAITIPKLSFDPATQAELNAEASDRAAADTALAAPAYITTAASGTLANEVLLSAVVLRDTRANQPAAGIPGRLYYVADEQVTERDNGSAWQDISDASGGGGGGDLVKLASVDLASPAATIDFASIPNTYRALRIVIQARLTAAVADAFALVQLNGDTGSNYHDTYTYSGGGAGGTTNQTSGKIALFAGASAPADSAGMATIDIPFYANTTFQKTLRATGADMYATATLIQADFAVRWLSTAAINQVTFVLASGNFDTGSQATLYGLT